MKNVAIFGDSILKGVLYENKKYFLSRAINWSEIENRLKIKITNSSRMGCTISKGGQIVEKTLAQGAKIDVALIEYGGNDSDFDWFEVAKNPLDKQHSNTDLQDFEIKLKNMVTGFRDSGIRPILMTLPPIDAERYFEKIAQDTENGQNILQFLGDVSTIFKYQESFSNVITQIASELNVQLVDVRAQFMSHANYCDLLCSDGIHPNEQGEKLIVDCFINTFEFAEQDNLLA